MAIRRILVPLTGVEGDRRALALGVLAARTLEAHVDALFVAPDPAEALPYLGEGVSGAVIEDILRAAKAASRDASLSARRQFDAVVAETKVPVVDRPSGPGRATANFRETQGRVGDVVERTSRLSDLVVFADTSTGASGVSVVEAALMTAGRPVLLAPKSALPATLGQSVAIGWDGSAEAAHAVAAAMPFLHRAKAIDIITVRTSGVETKAADELAQYLSTHGLSSRERVIDPKSQPVGQLLLDAAANSQADLLVMGGYGHSRLREFILGGATRHVLTAARMAVLMSH